MKKTQILAILNLLALLVHVTFAYLTQFKLINDQDVGQVADTFNSLFTPAGITFAIWGVIYTALLFFCIYHIRMVFRKKRTDVANENLKRMGVWFILNNIGASAWLLVWTNGMISASVGLIVFQLITLIILNLRLHIHDRHASIDSKIFTQFPLSIYFFEHISYFVKCKKLFVYYFMVNFFVCPSSVKRNVNSITTNG